MTRTMQVLATGPWAAFQDEGRPGLAAIGVSRSGAADRASYRLGGRLLHNASNLPAIEVLFGGLTLQANAPLMLVLTGADCSPTVDGKAVAHQGPFYIAAGQVLRLGIPSHGLRTYLSVRGGFQVPSVLGSASTDTLSGIGPAPLSGGDLIRVGTHKTHKFAGVDDPAITALDQGPMRLQVRLGPRDEWLDDPDQLTHTDWTVSTRVNRVGIRLEGGALARARGFRDRELPSEGVVRGAIQVPSAGQPLIFGADHPVTGGYPVVAVVRPTDADRAAQARPGQVIHFQIEAALS